MFNVAAAFGGGLLLRQQLDAIQLPRFQSRDAEGSSFKLSVRVVAASVPALSEPGYWSRQRPRLEAILGDVPKETELADYVASSGSDNKGRAAGACSKECPWRFGETLTFKVTLKDLLGPGLRLRLLGLSDINVGPLQVHLSHIAELGEACVDIRRRVLPGCVRCENGRSRESVPMWESPVLLIPMAHVRGGVIGDGQALGEAVGHVALSFSTDTDPEEILAAVDAEQRTVSDILADRAEGVFRWLNVPLGDDHGDEAHCNRENIPPSSSRPAALRTLTPTESHAALERAKARSCRVSAPAVPIEGPEFAPEGWVSRKGPNGRLYWHHRALGPAPWEDGAERLGL